MTTPTAIAETVLAAYDMRQKKNTLVADIMILNARAETEDLARRMGVTNEAARQHVKRAFCCICEQKSGRN